MATNQEMLDAVNNAIHQKMTGGAVQSYSISGRNIQYYSLKELIDLRHELQISLTAEQGGARNYAGFKRPS